MSNRKIINAAATGGIGYYPVVGASDPYYDKVSLLLTGDTEIDSNFANVSLLLTGNDLVDKSNNKATITAYGSATVSSAVKKFGTGSYYFAGSTGNYYTASSSNLAMGTGEFTIEFWFYALAYSSSSDSSAMFDSRSGNDATGFFIGPVYNDTAVMHVGQGVSPIITANVGYQLNTWTHCAVVRSGSTLTLYQNGVNVGSTTNTTNNTATVNHIGHGYWNGPCHNGYIDDLRITKGVARYTANFTLPVKALPAYEILDSSVYSLPVTTYGNARIDTTTKKYGTGSMYFDGTGDYLSLPSSSILNFGTGDFTVEMWINVISVDSQYPMLLSWSSSNNYFGISKVTTNTYKFASNFISSSPYRESTAVMNTGTWYFISIVRNSNTLSFYINGTLDGSVTETGSLGGTTAVTIGYNSNYASSYYFNGYIDDLRITKGYARYTANFTPPTYEAPIVTGTQYDDNYAQVSLLLNGDGTNGSTTFTDLSSSPKTITKYGNAQISTSTKKFGTGSINFDGTTCLIGPTSGVALLGSGNFTIEFWIYQVTNVAWGNIIGQWNDNSGTTSSWFCMFNASNNLYFGKKNSTTSGDFQGLNTSYSLPLSTWVFLTIVNNGGVWSLYANGTSVGSFTATTNTLIDGSSPLIIGAQTTTAGYANTCRIDDLRITKGIARYTQNFTPPTAPLPTSGGY